MEGVRNELPELILDSLGANAKGSCFGLYISCWAQRPNSAVLTIAPRSNLDAVLISGDSELGVFGVNINKGYRCNAGGVTSHPGLERQ